jgi:hypothetical protein
MKESGTDPDGARRRRSLEERITNLQAENAALIIERDRLFEALAVIAQNCLIKGIDIEDVMASVLKRQR